jgi:predicted nucleic acid-binding protein
LADSYVLDACVLYPNILCDTLLRLAEAGLYVPRWSATILDEVRRNLEERIPPYRVERRLRQMTMTFPNAEIIEYEELVESMTNAPDDRHVLAAAVAGDVSMIVTDNLKDFPERALRQFGVVAIASEHFLVDLYDRNRDQVRIVLERQAASYRNPPTTFGELLAQLEPHSHRLQARIMEDLV